VEKFYTIEDLADILVISAGYIRNTIRETDEKTGDFQGIQLFRIGRRWLTTREAIEKAIPAGIPGISTAAPTATTPDTPAPRRRPGRPRKSANIAAQKGGAA